MPLLAHYTSIQTLEKILSNDEIWFSNPLFMNDRDEVSFGVRNGVSLAKENAAIHTALETDKRREKFHEQLEGCFYKYDVEVFDNYVFCLSFHDREDTDGRLSMWRGYGGNGSGAAIVFDTNSLIKNPTDPLFIISKVHYGSKDRRREWLNSLLDRFAEIVAANEVPDEYIYTCAHALFERIKSFALFSKDIGFSEEREYRAVYLPERDSQKSLFPMFGYSPIGNGIEPKLKLKLGARSPIPRLQIQIEDIIKAIILGPTSSSVLAKRSVERMFDVTGKPRLKGRLFVSDIPFRTR